MQSVLELPPLEMSAPLDRCRDTIIADWVDANRHMNVAYYMLVFDKATEVFLQQVGAGRAYTASGIGTVFALEACIKYERELRLGDEVRITTRLVDHDRKLLHLLHSMYHRKSGRAPPRWNCSCCMSTRAPTVDLPGRRQSWTG